MSKAMNAYFEKTKVIRQKYIRYFPEACRLVDVGCGSGEWVRLMAESGFEACGVDSNPVSVERAQNGGLDVSLGDAIPFLQDNEKRFGGIICSHMIEHVGAGDVGELIAACHHALTEGGVLLILTPNVHTLSGMADFWNDPTHVKPYTEEAVKKLFRFNGLELVDIGYDEQSRIRPRASWKCFPVDLLRLVLGLFIHGRAARYNELFAVARRSDAP